RAIGCADVVALPVLRGRIMDMEEELEQVAEADAFGIEDDLHRLCVGAMVAVGRVGYVAPAVAHARGHHTVHVAKQLLHAPEAAAGEDRALGTHDLSSTWSRYAP